MSTSTIRSSSRWWRLAVRHGHPAAQRVPDQREARELPRFDHGAQIPVELLHLVAIGRAPLALAVSALVERDGAVVGWSLNRRLKWLPRACRCSRLP